MASRKLSLNESMQQVKESFTSSQGVENQVGKLEEKKSYLSQIREKIYNILIMGKDPFLFNRNLTLLNFIIEKNNRISAMHAIDIKEYLFLNFDRIMKLLDFYEKVNFEVMKTIKYRIQQNEINFRNFDEELSLIFTQLQKKMKTELVFIDYDMKDLNPKDVEEKLKESVGLGNYERVYLKINQRIDIYNIKDNRNSKDEIKKFTFSSAFLLFLQCLVSNWEIILYILMIFYYFFNSGISYIILLFYLFTYLMLEENKSKVFAWRLCFLYFAAIATIKFFFLLPIITPFDEKKSSDDLDGYTTENDYLPKFSVSFKILIFLINFRFFSEIIIQ